MRKPTDAIKIITEEDSNFQHREFTKSNTAIRYGIINKPTERQWKNIEKLVANIIQPVRKAKGKIRITSGFRSVDLCIKIKSSKNSNHAKGESADIEPVDPKVTLFEIFEWIYVNCKFRELIAEYFPEGWVHVTFREGGNIRKIKLKDNKHNYVKVDLEYIRKLYG